MTVNKEMSIGQVLNMDATTANIKAIFDADRTYRTYRVLDFKRMGKGKRLMARAISMRLYFTVALVLRKRYGRK